MKDKYKYVIDSSIWIEVDRKNSAITRKLSLLLNKNQICMVDLIIAELLRGARSQKDFDGMKLRLLSFEIKSTCWIRTSELAFKVAKAGFTPPLSDLYIAQCCIENGKTLITQDKHFKQIQKVEKFSLEYW